MMDWLTVNIEQLAAWTKCLHLHLTAHFYVVVSCWFECSFISFIYMITNTLNQQQQRQVLNKLAYIS
jgi:hypothetical protein